MSFKLPPTATFPQAARLENGWSDHYGAIQTAAAYAGLDCPTRYFLRGVWQHGCFGPWQNLSSTALAYSAPGARELPVWVARDDQAELLCAEGFQHVRVTGLPMVYTKETGLARQPGSLLVVPTHTLTGDAFADRSVFEEYADEIAAQADRFASIVVCVHPNCRRNGLWVDEFTRRGIAVVFGAETNDANALQRMRALFEQSEYVTTNGWGSHVAYALAFGAKVSIHGAQPRRTADDYLRDVSWQANPAGLRAMLSGETLQREREYLRDFLVPPLQGVADVARGRWLIGADHRLAPAEMKQCLAELVDLAGAAPRSGERRILFVSHEASRTGAPMFLLHFLRWLRRATSANFEVLLGKTGPLEDEFRKVGLVHKREDFPADGSGLKRFDLIYANTACNTDLLDAIGAGKTQVVTHIHELDMGYEWLGARRLADLLRQSHHLITCADAVTERVTRVFRVKPDRITRHYEMIDPDAARANAAAADAEALRRDYGIPANAHVVTACGTFDFRKAPDLFLQVAAQVKRTLGTGRPLRFLWVGAMNTPDLFRIVQQDVRKLGLETELQFVGELPSPHGLIGLSDIFCLTSREDPFPLVMLEAAAVGKPVVCFAGSGGAGEFCAHGGGVAVPYLDANGMADVCVGWLQDPAAAAAVGAKGAAAVREHFQVSAVAPGLWKTLQSLPHRTAPLVAPSTSLAQIYASWHETEAPHLNYRRAHLARVEARRQAEQLVRSGKAREAVQLLVRTVNVDLASKDGWIICESLCEIGTDLSRIDPKQGEVLLAKAREVAGFNGITFQQLLPRPPVPGAVAA